ncbi:MAG TPA: NAD-dependent epimerase/dehydratase family protein [Bacilli bacterium]|nr:NAD-dependent epimerase/dehydratase family protein [Bacilli bacterium]
MNVLVIGVTGLLGSEAAGQLIQKGHKVRGLALPPIPNGLNLPTEIEIIFGNYITASDEFLDSLFLDMDAFIFAAGIDERIDIAPPAYNTFNKYNVDPLRRMFSFAKKHGLKHSVVLGSYFTYFDHSRPKLELSKHHPYIASRALQKQMALAEASQDFSVAVLELPYIFGTQPGRKPVWVFLVKMLKKMKGATFFPRGGTAIVTVRQVGQAIVGALEKTTGGRVYPLGYYNLTWHQLFKLFNKYMGSPKKPIITVPNFTFKIAAKIIKRRKVKAGFEGGLDLPEFVKMQCSNQFIDRELAALYLGVSEDNLEQAIGASVKQSLAVLIEASDFVEMKT